MASMSVGPGDDIDAWCGKCLMVLSHRIIAMVGSQVKKVECLTCHAVHAYKRGVGEKRSGATSRTSTSGAVRVSKSSPSKSGKAENEWKVFMAEAPDDQAPRRYNVFESFSVSEFIDHPTFGVGKVIEITGAEKILVIFKEGRKTLVCNRARSSG